MSAVIGLGVLLVVVTMGVFSRRHNTNKFESWVAGRRPLDSNGIVQGADTVSLAGDAGRAVLILHGFGDTPQSIKPLATALHAAGWTVSAPLLPGHGRALRQYAAVRHSDWIDAITRQYDELKAQNDLVVVCGISLGAALAVLLAAARSDIPSMVLLAPYLAMPRDVRVKAALATLLQFPWPYHANTGGESSIHDPVARAATLGTGVVTASLLRELRTVAAKAALALPAVRASTLFLQSREDNRITESAAVAGFKRLGSPVKEQRWLTGCGHIITVDHCKHEVARQTAEWFAGAIPETLVGSDKSL